MTTLSRLYKILQICAKYSDPDTSLSSDHDIIYLPLDLDAPISHKDLEELEDLHANKNDVSWYVWT